MDVSPHKDQDGCLVEGQSANVPAFTVATARQLGNIGAAQEDCDYLLAPEWQNLYETKAAEMLQKVELQ